MSSRAEVAARLRPDVVEVLARARESFATIEATHPPAHAQRDQITAEFWTQWQKRGHDLDDLVGAAEVIFLVATVVTYEWDTHEGGLSESEVAVSMMVALQHVAASICHLLELG